MRATTIKLEQPLLNELNQMIKRGETLTSLVRNILKKEIQRRKMIEAAERYADFLMANPEEKQWLEEWENADLIAIPKQNKRKKKNGKR